MNNPYSSARDRLFFVRPDQIEQILLCDDSDDDENCLELDDEDTAFLENDAIQLDEFDDFAEVIIESAVSQHDKPPPPKRKRKERTSAAKVQPSEVADIIPMSNTIQVTVPIAVEQILPTSSEKSMISLEPVSEEMSASTFDHIGEPIQSTSSNAFENVPNSPETALAEQPTLMLPNDEPVFSFQTTKNYIQPMFTGLQSECQYEYSKVLQPEIIDDEIPSVSEVFNAVCKFDGKNNTIFSIFISLLIVTYRFSL